MIQPNIKSRDIFEPISLIVGMAFVGFLLFLPKIGLLAFWDGLVFLAPVLFAFAPFFWRIYCPLASLLTATSRIFPNFVKNTVRVTDHRFYWISIGVLIFVPPLRPWFIDSSGLVTGAVLLVTAVLALAVIHSYESKSAWCNGACPLMPVEAYYGQLAIKDPFLSACMPCTKCIDPCVDRLQTQSWQSLTEKFIGFRLITLGFPGYILGWFQISHFISLHGISLWTLYFPPLGGLLLSTLFFWQIERLLPLKWQPQLSQFTAMLSLAVYYWFKSIAVSVKLFQESVSIGALQGIMVGLVLFIYGFSLWKDKNYVMH